MFGSPKRVIQDFLESLAKVLHNFYNHQEVIPGLIKSNITVFKICSNSGQNTTTSL
jgi:arginyl-tRNA synthetase